MAYDEKFFYQQDTLSRFLQVLKRLGYGHIEQSTQLRIVQMLKDYLLVAYDLDAAEESVIEAFERFLFLHDTLLNDIFKDDKEAKERYQQMRFYYGVDLSDQGEGPVEGNEIMDEGKGKGKGKGKDPIEGNEIMDEGEGKDPIEGNSREEEEEEMY